MRPGSMNGYLYAENNPLKYTDPTGHLSQDEIKELFGRNTWDEVLASISNGYDWLKNKWGFLEFLRRVNVGDMVFGTNYDPADIPGDNLVDAKKRLFDGGYYLGEFHTNEHGAYRIGYTGNTGIDDIGIWDLTKYDVLGIQYPNSDKPKPKRKSRTRYGSPEARETG